MSTRSLTIFKEDATNPNGEIVLYRQMDGYPTGHGKDLKNFLTGFKITNGLPIGKPLEKLANGIGCLAAQAVAHFKTEPGQFYLYASGTRDVGEEYIYTVTNDNGTPRLEIRGGSDLYDGMLCLYSGTVEAFDPEAVEAAQEEE